MFFVQILSPVSPVMAGSGTQLAEREREREREKASSITTINNARYTHAHYKKYFEYRTPEQSAWRYFFTSVLPATASNCKKNTGQSFAVACKGKITPAKVLLPSGWVNIPCQKILQTSPTSKMLRQKFCCFRQGEKCSGKNFADILRGNNAPAKNFSACRQDKTAARIGRLPEMEIKRTHITQLYLS